MLKNSEDLIREGFRNNPEMRDKFKYKELALNYAINTLNENLLSEEAIVDAMHEGAYLKCVPKELRTLAVCRAATKKDPGAIRYIPKKIIVEAILGPYEEDGIYYTEDDERLYTRGDARKIINGTVSDVEYGIHDPYDILPEDFVY